MKRRILAFLMSAAMVISLATVFADAVPFAPPSMAWKDFGQANYYIYEVESGHAAPRMDGYVTDSDGYGDPIATYSIRYCTTADKVVYDEDGMRPEYKLRSDGEHAGEFYVYPTPYSPDEVWKSIASIETTSEDVFVMMYYREANSYSATGAYYYFNPYTLGFSRFYPSAEDDLVWPEDILEKGADVYTNTAGTTPYYERKLLREKPADWEESWNGTRSTKYYTLGYTETSLNRSFAAVTNPNGDGMPPFKANTYYEITDKILHVNQVYQASESSTANVATVTRMKNAHIILPEEVNRYACYDKNYYYEAVELVEAEHRYAPYYVDYRYGVSTVSQPAVAGQDRSFSLYLIKPLDGSVAHAVKHSYCRTFTNAAVNLSTAGYQAGVINKYGNLEAETIQDVYKRGSYFNITHQTWAQIHPEGETSAEEPEVDEFSEEETEDTSSGTYGLTTYEWKVPWSVINARYNPGRDQSAVPYLFNSLIEFQLDNKVGRGWCYLCMGHTRETRHLPGGLSTSGGNYSKTKYTMRYPSGTGMPLGKYNFIWANYSNGYNLLGVDYYVTDYYSASDLRTSGWYYTNHLFYTMGQRPADGYGAPTIEGVQIRSDDTENGQGFRIKVQIPTDITQDIAEAGVLAAPTEVARKTGLTYGMEQIAYHAEDFTEYYGIADVKNDQGDVIGHKWMNLAEDTDTYFAESSTPNDADSFIAQDVFGGKLSGLYDVTTCKIDLEEEPYESVPRNHYDAYVTSFTGLFDDFDDFFTFYTFRPYIKYTDGTVVYGEYEYKSIYYVACWAIEEFVDSINGTVGADINDRYTMDHPMMQAATDENGETVKDANGNVVYEARPTTVSSMSTYYGAAAHSLYLPEERLTVFRTNAIRVLNRVNRSSYRLRDYDNFPSDFKGFVDEYVEQYERIWKCIEECENKVYIIDRREVN